MPFDISQASLLRRCAVKLLVSSVAVAVAGGGPKAALAAVGSADDRPNAAADSTISAPVFDPADDGWFDLSTFMDKPYGFLPMVSPITEPAVGYGVWGGPTFISKPSGQAEAGFGRPNISFVGGAWTENDTWAACASDDRQWLDERLQTFVGLVYASINLKFYGVGEDALLKDDPLSYNLRPVGGLVRGKYRLGQSCFWVGLGYQWVETVSEIDVPDTYPRLHDIRRDSRVGGLLPLLNYDSRDNIFTPMWGTNVELSAGLFSTALGGDADFQTVNLTIIRYVSPHPRLTVGLRGDGIASFGDVPFYLLPSVSLRGAPAMRYQGEDVAQGELELRWQFWKRFSLIGFGGYGGAWNDFERLENEVTVPTVGTGFRYELARRYGVHAGVDVAWGPDDVAIYVQFGNAWMWK